MAKAPAGLATSPELEEPSPARRPEKYRDPNTAALETTDPAASQPPSPQLLVVDDPRQSAHRLHAAELGQDAPEVENDRLHRCSSHQRKVDVGFGQSRAPTC